MVQRKVACAFVDFDVSTSGQCECGGETVVCRREEIQEIYDMPLLDLVYRAASVHRKYHDPALVQKCTLLSIKTGGCPEDCNYCSQSSKHSKDTGTTATKLMDLDEVYEAAKRAKESGSTRFCMGAAWRGPSQVCPTLPHTTSWSMQIRSGILVLLESIILLNSFERHSQMMCHAQSCFRSDSGNGRGYWIW
jgi:hypothetical protein